MVMFHVWIGHVTHICHHQTGEVETARHAGKASVTTPSPTRSNIKNTPPNSWREYVEFRCSHVWECGCVCKLMCLMGQVTTLLLVFDSLWVASHSDTLINRSLELSKSTPLQQHHVSQRHVCFASPPHVLPLNTHTHIAYTQLPPTPEAELPPTPEAGGSALDSTLSHQLESIGDANPLARFQIHRVE